MKQVLVSALMLAAMAASAQAAAPLAASPKAPAMNKLQALRSQVPTAQVETLAEGTSRSGDTFEFSYAYEPYTALGSQSISYVGAAMQLDATYAKRFAGYKVTSVMIANGQTSNTKAPSITLSVFCSEKLGGAAIASASGSMDLSKELQYTEYTLDTPVTITEDKTLWFGFTCRQPSTKDYPLAMDYLPLGDYPGGYIGIGSTKAGIQWTNYGSSYGMTAIKLKIEGPAPENELTIPLIAAPSRTAVDSDFDISMILSNRPFGCTINNFEYTLSLNGEQVGQPETVTLSKPLTGDSDPAIFSLTASCPTAGTITADVNITKVNGEPFTTTASTSFLCLPTDAMFPRNMVVEECTGTWCGYCPIGMVGMEAMAEAHPDGTFIPIAVHNDDPMAIDSYSTIFNYISGFPSALVNRDPSLGAVYPSPANLADAYDEITAAPSVAKLEITNITEDSEAKTAKVETSLTIGFQLPSISYRLACVVTENNVGPYPQKNYYAGQSGDYGGWEKKGSSVTTTFNDVARGINNFSGVINSVPSKPAAGTYTHTATVSISNVKNLSHASYVMLLINTSTGEIENAVMAPSPAQTGISDIEADTDLAPARYFDLQGREVSAPKAGQLLIRTRGSKADKIVY